MRLDHRLPDRARSEPTEDPRDRPGAEIIDLATRNVLPAVTQRRPGRDGLGLVAGVVVVGMLGAVTLWSMDSARTARREAARPALAPAPGSPAAPLARPGGRVIVARYHARAGAARPGSGGF